MALPALLLALLLGAAVEAAAEGEFASLEEWPHDAKSPTPDTSLSSRDTEISTPDTSLSSRDTEITGSDYEVPTSDAAHLLRSSDTPTAVDESGEELPTTSGVQQIQDIDLGVFHEESSATTNVCEPCRCVDVTMDCSSQSMRAFLMKNTMSNITKLELSHNRLEELPAGAFMELPHLRRIAVTDNYIATVDVDSFQGLVALERLDMSVNAIATLPVTLLTNQQRLERLYLRRNRLTEVEFVAQIRNCSLEALQLSTNALARLPVRAFGRCTALRELWLDGNKISEVDADAFEGLVSLTTLDLTSNRLSDLPPTVFHPLRALRVLDMSRNHLVSIDGELFQTLSSLRNLYLPFNWLRDVPAGTFSACVSLRRLALSDNLIEHVDSEAFVSTPTQVLPKQKVIHSKCGNLTGSKANINLKTLDLSHNHLRSVPVHTFMSFPDIDELNLEYNLFTTFGVEMVCLAGMLGRKLLFAGNRLACSCGSLYDAFRLAERVAPDFHPVCLHSGEPWAVLKGRRCRVAGTGAAVEARVLAAAPPLQQEPPEPAQPVDNGFHAAVLAPILAVAFITSLAAMAVSVFRRYRRARYEVPQPESVRMTMYARAPSFTSATITNSTDVSRL